MPKLLARNARENFTQPCVSTPKLKLAFAPSADLDLIQQQAICKFAKLSELKAIAWWRVGLGKTRLALGLMALLYQKHFNNARRTRNSTATYGTSSLGDGSVRLAPFVGLVVARPAFEYDLRSELAQIGFDCQLSTEKNGWRFSATKPTLYFCSFASLQKVQDEMETVWRHLKLVIVDELYLFSNPKTQRSRELRAITEFKPSIGLSGSILPAGDNYAVWGQCSALGCERLLARGATRFRTDFQTCSKVDFKNGSGPALLFQNKPGWKEKAFARLGKNIDVQFPEKLNRTIDKTTTVPLTDVQKFHIKSLVDYFYLEIEGHEFDLSYTFQTLGKIRGILNGWVEIESGRLQPIASNKVSVLFSQLSELVQCREQVIVWCAFRNDVKYLTSLADFASLQMVGGREFDATAWRRKDAYVTFATMGSGSSINHFSQTPYSKFFSLSYKHLDLQQAKGRTDRRALQEGNVFYEFLTCDGSLDQQIYRHLLQVGATETDFIRSAELWLKTLRSHSVPK